MRWLLLFLFLPRLLVAFSFADLYHQMVLGREYYSPTHQRCDDLHQELSRKWNEGNALLEKLGQLPPETSLEERINLVNEMIHHYESFSACYQEIYKTIKKDRREHGKRRWQKACKQLCQQSEQNSNALLNNLRSHLEELRTTPPQPEILSLWQRSIELSEAGTLACRDLDPSYLENAIKVLEESIRCFNEARSYALKVLSLAQSEEDQTTIQQQIAFCEDQINQCQQAKEYLEEKRARLETELEGETAFNLKTE